MGYRQIITAIFVGFALLELAFGRFLHRERTRPKDVIIEVVQTLTLPLVILPTILTVTGVGMRILAPEAEGALGWLPGWAMFLILLVADDLPQYLFHRASHEVPLLNRLHRAHHSARYLSVRCVYRNSILYYLLLPGLWTSGVLLYLGFGPAYVVYAIAKLTVIIAAHSSVPWDAPLYRIPWLRPVMWVVVRTISTPSTHSAHHGMFQDDGVTNYKGNYGNFLFLWDVLFGTAKITYRRPEHFGLENIDERSWRQELLWPLSEPWNDAPVSTPRPTEPEHATA